MASDTAAGRGRRFKTKEAADAYVAHLKEPPTVVPATAALPPWVTICPPLREGGAWGYSCDGCIDTRTWRNFTDEVAARDFAALHVEVHHAH